MMNISPASRPVDRLDDAVAVLTFLADVAPALGDERHGGLNDTSAHGLCCILHAVAATVAAAGQPPTS